MEYEPSEQAFTCLYYDVCDAASPFILCVVHKLGGCHVRSI